MTKPNRRSSGQHPNDRNPPPRLPSNELFAIALRHHNAGQLTTAVQLYKQLISQKPLHPDAHNNLGNALYAQGQAADAIGHFRQAIRVRPNYVEAHNNLANAFHAAGRLEESYGHFTTALALKPTYAEAHNNFANLLLTLGRHEDAATSYKNALKLKPEYAEAHNNLAHVLTESNLLDEANLHVRQAITLRPDFACAYNNLGNVLKKQAEFADAEASYLRAIRLSPNYPEAHLNLGNLLEVQGRLDMALALYRKALALRPDYARAHLNRSLIQLKMGNFASGWCGHEWRWMQRGIASPRLNFAQPQWTGLPLNGARILLHAEQGLGDSIQFLRYVPMVRAAGGRVVLELPAELVRLAAATFGEEDYLPDAGTEYTKEYQLIVSGSPRPLVNFHCPLMSLPLAFKTELHTIPRGSTYLSVPQQAQHKATERLGKRGEARIGLAWAGNPKHLRDSSRSIALSALATLTQLEGVRLFSLQIGQPADELSSSNSPIEDLSSAIEDMTDTAALIQQLDLVISVDTSVAHLAGALGIPTWLMISTDSDWRWLINREDSPWYPSMRIFRQSRHGDWDSVIEHVKSSLAALMKSDRV